MPIRVSLFLVLLFVFSLNASGQNLDAYKHWHTRTFKLQDTLFIDSLALLPGSVHIENVAAIDYQVLHTQALIIWKNKPLQDSVTVHYRTIAVAFNKIYRNKSDSLISPQQYLMFDAPRINYRPGAGGLLQSEDINYTGSYARSFSMGNNQDVVLNSNFNFQVNGYLPDSIKVEAAITDNTIPFQPQGNTQRIQEFDQIYIRLSKKQHSLQVGDYNLERPKGYFLNYFKRVQGVYFQSAVQPWKTATNSFGVSGSVAKGQFVRNIIQGVEGNQGPYRLQGNNGEQFFIVLAGTEKVYIDNVLMQRGENADYIIDYNTAEILFMPRKLISKDARIQVEFEYQDRNYVNSLIYAYNDLQIGKKLNIRVNAYSNQDAKNQPYLQTLDAPQKLFLASIGDSIQNAFYPGASLDTFAANKILYKRIDTIVGGITYDSVYVYTTNADSAQYNLAFSFVGEGKGNYVLQASNANGRVYTWVAPLNGIRQGNYEPVILLIAPKKHQLWSALADYQIDSLKKISVEYSGSNYDPNLFSKLDNHTHYGSALRAAYDEQRHWGNKDKDQKNSWTWKNNLSYEMVEDNYKAIAPYRNVEFLRDWNLPITNQPATEHLGHFTTNLEHRKGAGLLYQLSNYTRQDFYNGWRNMATLYWKDDRKLFSITYNKTEAQDTAYKIHFLRPSAEAQYKFKNKWPEIGAKWAMEDSRMQQQHTAALHPLSFSFTTFNSWMTSSKQNKNQWSLRYYTRSDKLPLHNELTQQSHSNNYEGNFTLAQWKNHLLNLSGTYRQLIIDDTTINNSKAQESVVARMEYTGSIMKNLFNWRTLYEIGNGQEQKRNFTYVEVPAGQGQYQWIDYNNDGVQQANEFELAVYNDQKRFVRIIVPTNEYVKTNYINFYQTLNIEPANKIDKNKAGKFLKGIALFSSSLNVQVNNRILTDEGMYVFIPFAKIKNSENIIATSTLVNQTVYFNRLNTKWGLDYNYSYTLNRFLLTYGIEAGGYKQHLLKGRWNLPASWTVNIALKKGERNFLSPLEDNRSYLIQQQGVEPSITWIHKALLRITATYKYEEKKNSQQWGNQQATFHTAGLDMRIAQPSAGVIQIKGSYTRIHYNGASNESIAFNMLESLQSGNNFLWLLGWQRQLGKGIELSLDYEGRKMENAAIIHTGRMTLRAIL